MTVKGHEGGDGGAELGEVLGSADVDDLSLEGAVGAFDDAVGLRFAEEGEAGDKAVEASVGLEEVGEILGAVVVALLDAAGGVRDGAEGAGDGLGERFPGGEAVAGFCRQASRGLRRSSARRGRRAQTHPSATVQILAPSVALRRLGASVMMRPSWALAGTKAARYGESRRCEGFRGWGTGWCGTQGSWCLGCPILCPRNSVEAWMV